MIQALVVDDDPAMSGLIEFVLQQSGLSVVVANSAQEALVLVAKRVTPEVAVLDVAMPVIGGIELIFALRDREGLSSLPAIFLSSWVNPDDVEEGEELGAIYLAKPLVGPALLTAVYRLIEDADLGLCAAAEMRMAQRDYLGESLVLSVRERRALVRLTARTRDGSAVALRARIVLARAGEKTISEVAG
jgi:CheY-like chemotaxis protein